MHYKITATLRKGSTILDEDAGEFELNRHAPSESRRDEIIKAFNTLGAVKLTVEQS